MGPGSEFIEALCHPDVFNHPVDSIQVQETHISWVLLTGPLAYKLRKPLKLGFLDFTTLDQRLHDCREELRLNRRLVDHLYLGLSAVLGTAQGLRMVPMDERGGAFSEMTSEGTTVLEVAVRMRQFRQSALLPATLARGALGVDEIHALAETLARFHCRAPRASADDPFGTPQVVLRPVIANFTLLLQQAPSSLHGRLKRLQTWTQAEFQKRSPLLWQRKASGRIRECHGDLHLGNMLWEGEKIEVFDCLEFNPALRWIDVISEMAFLVMDLDQKGYASLGNRLLNRWLEWCGDYGALALWRWYVSYRALVRAKVAVLSGDHSDDGLAARYVAVAEDCMERRQPCLMMCHGVSGSGKSHFSAALAAELRGIRIRSDVERKRWFGRWGIPSAPVRQGNPYSATVSAELFDHHLPDLAEQLLLEQFTVIVDATFLWEKHRQPMANLAERLGVPWLILNFQTPADLVRRRIVERMARRDDPSDADLAVLEQQDREREPLTATEMEHSLAITPGTSAASMAITIEKRWRPQNF